jgi:hypothetical protein
MALSRGPAHAVPDWENPSVLGINKRGPHVPLKSFPTLRSATQNGRQQHASPRLMLLSQCEWDFKLYGSPALVPEDFPSESCADGLSFGQIFVPRSWETCGHGTPIYTNFVYPIPVDPPYVPSDNPTGCYKWVRRPRRRRRCLGRGAAAARGLAARSQPGPWAVTQPPPPPPLAWRPSHPAH